MTERIVREFPYDEVTIREDRNSAIGAYVDSWDDLDTQDALHISSQLDRDDAPLPDTVVIIPVAAHTEASNVFRTLSLYGAQEGHKPFAVHLHLNWPAAGELPDTVLETAAEAVRAKNAFPRLDLRMTVSEHGNAPIGHIRRIAWNGTLQKMQRENEGLHQSIGINHDIDLMSMSRHYIARVQEYYQQQDSQASLAPFLPVAVTQSRHFPSPSHPNTTKAVFWSDFTNRIQRIGFEAGMTIPFATYAQRGGFNRSSVTNETANFHVPGKLTFPMIPGTSQGTSMRRYLDRLPENGYGGIWNADSFGAEDACRSSEDFEDISEFRLQELVREDALEFAQVYVRRLFNHRLTFEQKIAFMGDDSARQEEATQELLAQTRKVGRMTAFVLDRIVGVEGVGSVLANVYFDEDVIRQRSQVARFRMLESRRILDEIIRNTPATPVASKNNV